MKSRKIRIKWTWTTLLFTLICSARADISYFEGNGFRLYWPLRRLICESVRNERDLNGRHSLWPLQFCSPEGIEWVASSTNWLEPWGLVFVDSSSLSVIEIGSDFILAISSRFFIVLPFSALKTDEIQSDMVMLESIVGSSSCFTIVFLLNIYMLHICVSKMV